MFENSITCLRLEEATNVQAQCYCLATRCSSIHICQRITNIGLVTGLGGHFVTKVCNRRGCSATNPSATSPLKTDITLHRGPRQRFVTEGGARDNTGFDPHLPVLSMCLFILSNNGTLFTLRPSSMRQCREGGVGIRGQPFWIVVCGLEDKKGHRPAWQELALAS